MINRFVVALLLFQLLFLQHTNGLFGEQGFNQRHLLEKMLSELKDGSRQNLEFSSTDGSRRTLDRSSAIKHLQDQLRLTDENGELINEKRGEAKLEELKETDPQLYRWIRYANIAHKQLQKDGYAQGTIAQVFSSPREDEIEKSKEETDHIYLVIVVKTENDEKEAYEVKIGFKKQDETKVLLRVVEAWRFDLKKKIAQEKLDIEVINFPPLMFEGMGDINPRLILFAVAAGLSGIVLIFVTRWFTSDDPNKQKNE